MEKPLINRAKIKNILLLSLIIIFAQVFTTKTFAQKQPSKAKISGDKTSTKTSAPVPILPKVTQIDDIALKNLLKRNGENTKPLLINFWATWCDPCREEFPELVKIDEDYKDKINFITISLDDVEEINRAVPKFLVGMKAQMPAYLLKTDDEEAAIASVTKDWQGGLPFTVLINEKGEIAYIRQGKIKAETVRSEIDKTLNNQNQTSEFSKGVEDAKQDIANGKLFLKTNDRHSFGFGIDSKAKNQEVEESIWEKYNITLDYIYTSKQGKINYLKGYNSVAEAEIIKKYGEEFLIQIKKKFWVNYPADVIKLELTQK